MLALAARQSVPVLLLTGFGFGLLAVTANVVLLPRLLYAAPASVLEGLTLGRAFRRSWTLSRGRFWSLIGVLALVGALAVLVFWVTEFPQQLLYNLLVDMLELSPRVRDEAGSVTFAMANLGSAIIVTPFLASNVVLHYLDARIRKEGFDLAPVSYTHLDVYKRQDQDRVAPQGSIGSQVRGILCRSSARRRPHRTLRRGEVPARGGLSLIHI